MQRSQWGSPRRAPPTPASLAAAAASPGSPAAASPPLSSSLDSQHLFDLSPEVLLPGGGLGLPQHPHSSLPAATAADGDDSSSESGDDLSSFLAVLKAKYGLPYATAPLAAPAPAAPPVAAGTAGGAAAPSSTLHVHVRVTSSACDGDLPGAAAPQAQPQLPAPAAAHSPARTHWADAWAGRPAEEEQTAPRSNACALPPASTEPAGDHPPALHPAALPIGTQQQEGHSNPPAPVPPAQPQQEVQEVQHPAGLLPGVQREGLLSEEVEAELDALEALQRQATEQQAQQQQPAADAAVAASAPAAGAWGGTVEAAALPHGPPSQLPWAALHAQLLQSGFPGLLPDDATGTAAAAAAAQPDPAALFGCIQSLLREQARGAAHQQRLAEAAQAAAQREGALVSSLSAAAKQRDAEIAKWKRLALESQRAAREAELTGADWRRSKEQVAADARQLQTAVARLEHALHSKEGEVQRIQALLAQQQQREERRRRADAEALARLKQAHAASKAADTLGGAAGVLKAACSELSLKPLDILRICEAERANLQEASALAAADADAARAQLARAQEALHSAGLPCEQHELIEGQARAAARQAAAAEERAAQAEEEAAALRAELAARPTQASSRAQAATLPAPTPAFNCRQNAQLESVQRQAAIMERQLARAAADKAAAEAKDARSRPKPPQRSTRELIQRDRGLQRLGLHSVEELPKPVLVELVQDACLLLECPPLDLAAAIRPVQDVAALVPRMERFIGDVCGAVFQRGLAHVPEALRADNPADVPAILAAWIAELGELVETRGVLRALLRQLASRVSVQPTDPPPTAGEVAPLVAGLVDLERRVFHSQEVIQAAEAALAAQPEVLLNAIVLQFQRLFGCRGLEGVLPAMNRLYLAHTEAQTFLTSLRTALGLPSGASLEACAIQLEQLLGDRRGALATMLPAREAHAAAPLPPPSAQAVVVEVPPLPRPPPELQQAAQAAVERMAQKRGWPVVEIYVPAGASEAPA